MNETMKCSVLVIDDDADIQQVLKDRLEFLGYPVLLASNGSEGLGVIERDGPQMVFLDVELPDMNGLSVLEEIRRQGRDLPVVMITAYGSVDRAVQAMKEGAYDFVPKPFNPEHIALIAKKALERANLKRELEILTEEVSKRYHLVVGRSIEMNRAVDAVRKAASSNSTVLLLGESGTGKEIFARGIHSWSQRRDQPFVAINCVGLSRELLESELFGHEKGAFTGAFQQKKGKMELAHGGTVFLDEVGDVSPEIQTKLLRFLQEREFERVGGTKPIHVDVRIVAATNRDLEAAVKNGHFREDLYYRLNVVLITLPPLRKRKEDIPDLANYFLRRFGVETKKNISEITPEAQDKLLAYDWPGNVREFANVIESAVVLGQGAKLTVEDLPSKIVAAAPAVARNGFSYYEVVDDYRREVIRKALSQTLGNRAAAARLLGLQRTYLSRLIRTLKVS